MPKEKNIGEQGSARGLVPMRNFLLSWYDQHARSLPWRQDRDPYRIWLSEVMLQQTRVETVIPYYHRFLDAYPTLDALSVAEEGEVLKLWEGLGYYARARHFLGAIQEVQTRYAGWIPQNPEEFRGLPGVGEYTTAAVMSIAFGLPLAAIDGNVKRVISRLFCLEETTPKGAAREIKVRANALLDAKRPGDFNQALMDLGSSICTPRNPSCNDCPVKLFCRAYSEGKADSIPPKKKQKPLPLEEITAVLMVRGKSCLIRQRPREGLLGSLWELPTLRSDTLTAAQVTLGEEIAVLHHQFSHLRWKVVVFGGELNSELPLGPPWRWVTAAELATLPFPAVYQPVVDILGKHLDAQPK